jgi:hypothetical protein
MSQEQETELVKLLREHPALGLRVVLTGFADRVQAAMSTHPWPVCPASMWLLFVAEARSSAGAASSMDLCEQERNVPLAR